MGLLSKLFTALLLAALPFATVQAQTPNSTLVGDANSGWQHCGRLYPVTDKGRDRYLFCQHPEKDKLQGCCNTHGARDAPKDPWKVFLAKYTGSVLYNSALELLDLQCRCFYVQGNHTVQVLTSAVNLFESKVQPAKNLNWNLNKLSADNRTCDDPCISP